MRPPLALPWLSAPMEIPRVRPSTRVAVSLAVVATLVYAAFILTPSRRGDLIPWLALVGAELVLLANTLGMWWTTLSGDRRTVDRPEVEAFRAALLAGEVRPSIDVLITVCGEPLEVVERTARAARDMRLAHRTYICDDGRSDAVRTLCQLLGVGYLRRHDHRGAKAGNVNAALARTHGDFVALFDADHTPHPDFLVLTVPHMARPELAFTQSPQTFVTDEHSFVECGSAESQQMFYEAICPGKNRFDAAFHVGTNALFRRAALTDAGGFFEDTHSEDIWTSIRLHQRGWSSTFLPHIVARGLSPATVHAHLRQQRRWASGSFEILLRGRPLTAPGLTLDQRLQYLQPPLHFLTSFANVLYMLLPPLFLLFGVTPVHSGSGVWLLAWLPVLLLTHVVQWLQVGAIKLRPVVLSVATAPVHVQAFFIILLGRKRTWQATGADVAVPSVAEILLPQLALMALMVLNVTAVVVGLSAVEGGTATAISVGLCTLHTLILGRVAVEANRDRRRAVHDADPPHAEIDLRDHISTGAAA